MSNFNFEEYRQPWETGPHWELKREFMEKYQNDFPEDRLLCLAQAYSNIELMRCSYPSPVMLQIHELSKSLDGCKRFREAYKLKEEQNSSQRARKGKRNAPSEDSNKPFKFIKFCSAIKPTQSLDHSQSSETKLSSYSPVPDDISDSSGNKAFNNSNPIDTQHIDASNKSIQDTTNFVLHLTNSPDFKKIKAVADEIKVNPVRQKPVEEIERAVCNSNLESLVNFKFNTCSFENMLTCLCKFYIGSTLVSIGRDNNEKNARMKAAEYAVEILSNLYNLPCKTLSDLQNYWIEENVNFCFKHKDCCQMLKSSNLNNKGNNSCSVVENGKICEKGKDTDRISLHFWLKLAHEVEKHVGKNLPAAQILEDATKRTDASKIFYFNFNEELNTPLHSRIFCCSLVIEKTLVCQGKDSSKKKAKSKALENGVICMMDLIKWNKEHIESLKKSGEILGSLNAQQNSKENLERESSSEYSKAKKPVLPSINLCELSSNSETNQSDESPHFKTIIKSRADSVCKSKDLTISQESNSQVVSDNVIQKHEDVIKDESLSNPDKLSIISTAESNNGNIHTKPIKFTLNKRLLLNSYSKQLVVFDTSAINPANLQTPGALLNYSASFCQKQMTYETDEILSTSGNIEHFRFRVLFDGEVIGTGEAPIKSEAKANAAHCALKNLQKNVYTIKVKTEVEESFVINRTRVIDGNYPSNAVSDNNIGCKMLKMMGWSGGSIGKSGGITEPIVARDNQFHQGLGFQNTSENIQNFTQKIEALLRDFSQTNTTSDLVFSKDFTKEERKNIHRMAVKHHLNTSSRGKNKHRQLFVRRKICLNELLNLIVQAGGSTSKYEMVDCSLE